MVAMYVEKKKNIQPNLEQNLYRLVQNSQQIIDRDCATYTARWKFCSKVEENKKGKNIESRIHSRWCTDWSAIDPTSAV